MDKYEFRRKSLMALVDSFGKGGIAAVAKRIGKDQSYVSRMLYPPNKEGMKRIGEDSVDLLNDAFPEWLNLQESSKSKGRKLLQHVNPPENSVEIPVTDAIGSMGVGHPQPENDAVIDHIRVTKPWVQSNFPSLTSPGNLAAISACGDSMQPTFNDGDVLIVDRGVFEVKVDAIYILSLNDELYIKRLQRRPDGSILMISDNQNYKEYMIENGERNKFQVLGRVMWVWNGRKL